MKHAAKEQKPTKKERQIRRLKILAVLLVFALTGAAITIYRDYQSRPGFLKNVWVSETGADYLTVSWEKVRNVRKYVVMCDGKIMLVSGRKDSATVKGLAENRDYEISVRADSRKRKGFKTVSLSARTKKATHIVGKDQQTKFINRPADLKQTAETKVTYEAGNGYTVTPEGKVVFTRPGRIKVTAVTEETAEYAPIKKEIIVNVLDTVADDPSDASLHVFYHLNKENCKRLLTVEGSSGATGPQSFVAYDDGYIIAFVKNDKQRIVTYGSTRKAYKPETDLGHCNGMTIADGYCYAVRGYLDKTCTIFEPPNRYYGTYKLDYGASGIAYDRKTGQFYTSSRKLLTVYDKNFNVVRTIRPVRHSGTYYAQDCGAYGGILMHCITGKYGQGTNYIDFYDTENGKYLGTIECELNEVESLIVDDEGFIELLCQVKVGGHGIWKTPLNIMDACE